MLDLSPLNPQQRLAVETLRGPVLILAGAGTGKTRVITYRIARLIERGVAPGNILAVTFTNKAAREMLERVNRMLPNRRISAGAFSESGGEKHLLYPSLSSAGSGGEGARRAGEEAPGCMVPMQTKKRQEPSHGPALTGTPATLAHPMGEGRGGGVSGGDVSMHAQATGGTSNLPRPTICTFHSFGVRVLRRHIDRLGYKKSFVIYSESDQLGAIKKILSHISAKGEKADPQAILGFLSRYRNGGDRATAFADPSVAALAEHVRARYESALRACNAVDFDDLLLLTLKLLEEHADILAACRDRFRYVMVDEYQDTNAAQFRLVHLLTREHRNLCVVGDDDQSIYGWRGAEIANLLDMEKHFPEVKVVRLEQNYRSTNIILRAANAVIKNNARRRGKQLWSHKGQGTKLALHAFKDDSEEGHRIVELIEYARLARRVRWQDQAILFRTNIQSRALETALRQAGVRYHLIGGQSYFDRREVKDFLAYLKVFANPHEDVSLLRIANVPARGLSDATMQRLLAISQERHCSVYAAMQHADVAAFNSRTRDSLEAFVELVERTRAPLHGDQPLSLRQWAGHFLTVTGYLEELRRSEKDPETAENRIRNLQDLVVDFDLSDPADGGTASQCKLGQSSTGVVSPLAPSEGERAGVRGPTTGPDRNTASDARSPKPIDRLQTFLDDLTLDQDREDDEAAPGDAVTLITMHSCKGLEFPHVYIVGLEEGLLPHSRSKVEGTLEEERRLFYVAITRAQETLTLSYCLARKKYGQPVPCHPSSFLHELPPDLVEAADDASRQPVAVDSGKQHFAAMRGAVGSP